MPVLGVLIIIGAWLRLVDLGALGFRWDEDLSSLAVQAILLHGIPELPSGMIYLRGGTFLYLMAASAELFGFSEASLRLPAALFGIGLIPLGYAFGRALFDVRTGLVVAGLITISQWDVEFSRYARMYAPFAFFYLLTLLCLWKYRVTSVSTGGGILCAALALYAVSLHQLGYTLVLAFFYPLILRGPAEWLKPRNWLYPVTAGAIVAAFFFYWSGTIGRYMERPLRVEGQGPPVPAETADPGGVDLAGRVPLLDGLLDASLPLAIGFAAVLLLAAAWLARHRGRSLPERLLLLAVAVCCALQLFNLALLALLGLAFVKREGLGAVRRPDVVFAAGLIGVSFLLWIGLAAALGFAPDDPAQGATGLKGTIRSLLNYPHFFVFWGYAREWPLMSIIAVIGGLYAFDRASQPAASGAGEDSRASGFLLLALGTPLIVNGLFETSFEMFRYNVPFNTLYFTFVALALVHWRSVAAALPFGSGIRPGGAAVPAITAALALLVLAYDLNPLRPWLVTRQDYLNNGALYRAFGLEWRPDFKTPAAFIESRAEDDDLIIVLDSREYYNYLGELDYWVRTGVYESQTYSRGGTLHDRYIGTPLIMSLDELQDVLARPNQRKWLAASDRMLSNTVAVTDDIKAFVRGQEDRVVYVGRDGTTKVYLFE